MFSSRNIFSYDFAGAFSRKSKLTTSPSLVCATKKPPPPILPFEGDVTANVNPVATTASNAFPPFFKKSIPTFEAIFDVDETAPFLLLLSTFFLLHVEIIAATKIHCNKIFKALVNFNIFICQ